MKNMGKLDRIIRVVLGLGLVIGAIISILTGGSLWWLMIPGVILLITSAISTCPLYLPFGLSTIRKK